MEQTSVALSPETQFQQLLKWMLLVVITVAFITFFGFIFFEMYFVPNTWLLKKMQEQFAVTISMPFAGVVALFVVLLLQFSAGPIEFEAPGFKFKGASGPIVMWIACFLAIVAAIKILWIAG